MGLKFLEWLAADDPPPLSVRVAVVAAHPDDEVIGMGSRMPRFGDATFVHATDGAPRDGRDAAARGFEDREQYARARHRELEAALALAGIDAARALVLEFVDQEAALHLAPLARLLAELLRGIDVVLTHPYEGGHPDHDATAFGVHAACRLISHEGAAAPIVIEMTSYHNSATGLEPETFLPAAGCESMTVVLSPEERELKRRLLACFTTQRSTLASFPGRIERFRTAPRYDFTRPPHDGKLFYELYPWGMTGARFRELAGAALAALGIGGTT